MMELQVLCGIVPKIQDFFYRPDLFHQNDENGVFNEIFINGRKCVFDN